jgi:hypothetical protein
MRMPRRVHRRLLLPPGWAALGFLLLLGCQALRQRAIRQWNVLQVTMPALRIDKSASWSTVVYQPPAQLASFRRWHDVKFTGESLADFWSVAAAESATRQLIADTIHAGGVRIHFLAGSTYANLIKALDIMLYTDQKKYWLDIRHQQLTLYAITMERERKRSPKPPVYLGCCTCGSYLVKHVTDPHWQVKFRNLWLKSWQPTTLLLALIGILNLWTLLRLRLSTTPTP